MTGTPQDDERDEFERELSGLLHRHHEPADDSLVGASLRRARRLQRRRQATSALLAVALVAGGSATVLHLRSGDRAVPAAPASTAAATPGVLPSLIPTTHVSMDDTQPAPTCTATNATWRVERGNLNDHLQVWYVTVQATKGVCAVKGYPTVTLVDAAGKAIGQPAVQTGPAAKRVVVSTRRRALSVIRYDTTQRESTTCRPKMSAGIRVVPPGERVAVGNQLAVYGCQNPLSPVMDLDAFIAE